MLKFFLCSIVCFAGFAAIAGPSGLDRNDRNRINRLFVISIGVSSQTKMVPEQLSSEKDSAFYYSFPCAVCLSDAEGVPAYMQQLRRKVKTIDTLISRQFVNTSLPFDSIMNAFRTIQQMSRPEDVFVFYYAGISWGTFINPDNMRLETYYAFNKDINGYNSKFAFTLSQLKTLTDRIAAQRQLIIFDSGQGDAIQNDFYGNFFNDKPAEALFSKKERVILCPENYSGESTDSSGTRKGDMFKIISSLPDEFNVFRLFENKATNGINDKNNRYKQFMQHWYKQQMNCMAQVKVLREQDYLKMLTSMPANESSGKRGNVVLVKEKQPDTALLNRKKIALIFASDEYNAAALWNPLKNALNDGREVAKLLQQSGYEVRTFFNSAQDSILNAIAELADGTENLYNQYVIYFAGHGYYDARQQAGYIVCSDSKQMKDPSRPTAAELRSYIDYTVLFRNLEQLNKVVMITDVCFGGTSMNSQLQTRSTVSPDKTAIQKNPYKRVLSSGVTAVDDFIKMHNGTASQHSPFATALFTIAGPSINGLSFDKIYAELGKQKLAVKPIEFYFGENIKPNEFVF